MSSKKYIISVFVLILFPIHLFAEDENVVLSTIFRTLTSVDSLINHPQSYLFYRVDTLSEPDLFSEKEKIGTWVKEIKEINRARTGLNLNVYYDFRFGPNIFDDYDDQYMGYRNRIHSTLSWNITQSGLIGKEQYNRRAELLGEKKHLSYKEATVKEMLAWYSLEREDLLNAYYNKVLDTQIQLIQSLLKLQAYLQREERVLPIEVIDLKYKLSLLQGEYRPSSQTSDYILDVNEYLAQQTIINQLSTDSILEKSTYFQQKEIDQQLLVNEEESISYLKKIDVSPFLRGQYYDRTYATRGNSQFVTNIGISVSLPLSNETKAQRKEVKSRALLMETESAVDLQRLKNNVQMVVRDLNDNLRSLTAAFEAKQHYAERVAETQKLFKSQKTPIQSLIKEYDRLLECHRTICSLVGQREQLMTRFISVRRGVFY